MWCLTELIISLWIYLNFLFLFLKINQCRDNFGSATLKFFKIKTPHLHLKFKWHSIIISIWRNYNFCYTKYLSGTGDQYTDEPGDEWWWQPVWRRQGQHRLQAGQRGRAPQHPATLTHQVKWRDSPLLFPESRRFSRRCSPFPILYQ